MRQSGAAELRLFLPDDGEFQAVLSLRDAALDRVRDGRGHFVGRQEPAGGLDRADAEQFGHEVNQRGAAESARREVADDVELHVVVDDELVNRAVGGAHAEADARALERRPGGGRATDEPVLVADDQFAVRADVNGQRALRRLVHPGGEDHADGVRADEPGDVRKHVDHAVRVDAQPDVAAGDVGRAAEPGDVRRLRHELGVHAEKEMAHRGVAHHGRLVQVLAADAGGLAAFRDDLVQAADDLLLQFAEAVRVRGGVADAAHHVVAERDLRVGARRHRQLAAADEVHQEADDGRRPDVERDAEVLAGRVARFQGHEAPLRGHGGHVEIPAADDRGQFPQHAQVEVHFLLAERGEQPVRVRALVVQRRRGQRTCCF